MSMYHQHDHHQQRGDRTGGDRRAYDRRGPPRHYDDQRGGSSGGRGNYGDGGNQHRHNRDGPESRKRHGDGENRDAPPAKQSHHQPLELGVIDADIMAKVNGQMAKMNYKDIQPEQITELQQIVIYGELDCCEAMKNDIALFLGKTAMLLANRGASICSPPPVGTIPSSKNLISVASALLNTCSFLQMGGDQLQLLEAPICDRICELHLEVSFNILDLTSPNCKALTKWLLGKKSKKTSKKLFLRTLYRDFTSRWIGTLKSDMLDNQYQVLIQCNFELHPYNITTGTDGSMIQCLCQIGKGEYLLSKFPAGQASPQKPDFALNGPVTKVTFTNSKKPAS